MKYRKVLHLRPFLLKVCTVAIQVLVGFHEPQRFAEGKLRNNIQIQISNVLANVTYLRPPRLRDPVLYQTANQIRNALVHHGFETIDVFTSVLTEG